MKKIFLLLLLLPVLVKASSWTSTLPNETITILKQESRYKWYKLVEKDVSYKKESECICEYLDKTDYIYDNEEKTLMNEFNDYYSYDVAEELSFGINEFKYIVLSNVGLDFLLKELAVKRNGLPLKYKIINLDDYMQNSCVLVDGYGYKGVNLKTNDKLILEFDNVYNTNVLINIYTQNIINVKELDIKIEFMTELNYPTLSNEFHLTGYYCPSSEYCIYDIIPNNTWKSNSSFTKTTTYYKEKLYKCYDLEKEYLEGYHTKKSGYIKDKNNKVTYYQYKPYIEKVNILKSTNPIIIEEKIENKTSEPLALLTTTEIKKSNYQWLIFLIIFVTLNVLSGVTYLLFKKKKSI